MSHLRSSIGGRATSCSTCECCVCSCSSFLCRVRNIPPRNPLLLPYMGSALLDGRHLPCTWSGQRAPLRAAWTVMNIWAWPCRRRNHRHACARRPRHPMHPQMKTATRARSCLAARAVHLQPSAACRPIFTQISVPDSFGVQCQMVRCWSVNFGRTFSHSHTESSRRCGCDAGRRDTGGQLRFNVLLEIIHVTWLARRWRPPVLAKVRFQQ